jgi:hypothetical protein
MTWRFWILCFCIFLCRSVMYKMYLIQIDSSRFGIGLLLFNVLLSNIGKIYSTFIKSLPMRLACYFFVFQSLASLCMVFNNFYLTVLAFSLSSILYGVQTSFVFSIMGASTNRWNLKEHYRSILVFCLTIAGSLFLSLSLVRYFQAYLALIFNLLGAAYFYLNSQGENLQLTDLIEDNDKIHDWRYILTSVAINFVSNAVLFILNSEYTVILQMIVSQILLFLIVIKQIGFISILIYNSHLFVFQKTYKLMFVFQMMRFCEYVSDRLENGFIKTKLENAHAVLRKDYIYGVLNDFDMSYRTLNASTSGLNSIMRYLVHIIT